MAHPKRKISRTRRDKRRTHCKISPVTVTICNTTGEVHRPHRAYWHEGNLYLNGKVVISKEKV